MNPNEEKITAIIKKQQDAWNRADAAGLSSDCHEEMTFTPILGQTYFGRAAFEERHQTIFATIFKDSSLDMAISRIHFPTPDVAVVDIHAVLGNFRALPPGVMAQKDGMLHTCLLEVLVRSGSSWQVMAYHNVDTKA